MTERDPIDDPVTDAPPPSAVAADEEERRFAEAKFEAILRGALDAVISIDEEQRIELFNEGAERIFGYRREEVLGKPLDILLPEGFREVHRRDVEAFGSSPSSARLMGERGEIMGRRKSGEIFPAEASIAKVEVGGRRVYTAVLRDITRRKRAEEERARLLEREREARERAERATRARDEMLRVVSHDLKNPVTGILMGAKMLRRRLGSEGGDLNELLEGIELSAARLNRQIRDLVDVESIQAGRLAVHPSPHDPGSLLGEAARTFRPQAAGAELEVELHVQPGLPAVLADRDRVLQVLHNLLDNAAKFTPRGGTITLEARSVEREVEFAVADTGPGIPEEELPHVFERFWSGAGAQIEGKAGTGIGLAIARGIVEQLGGEIRASSSRQGSVFSFTLPVADA